MYHVIYWEKMNVVDKVIFSDLCSALSYANRALAVYKLGDVTVHDMNDGGRNVTEC